MTAEDQRCKKKRRGTQLYFTHRKLFYIDMQVQVNQKDFFLKKSHLWSDGLRQSYSSRHQLQGKKIWIEVTTNRKMVTSQQSHCIFFIFVFLAEIGSTVWRKLLDILWFSHSVLKLCFILITFVTLWSLHLFFVYHLCSRIILFLSVILRLFRSPPCLQSAHNCMCLPLSSNYQKDQSVLCFSIFFYNRLL